MNTSRLQKMIARLRISKMRNKGKKKSLLNFLIEIKGYTYADVLATEIKYWDGEDLPENIENDCDDWWTYNS